MKNLIAIAAAISCMALLAQTPTPSQPKKEVAKVKHTDADPVSKTLAETDSKDFQILALQQQLLSRNLQDIQAQQNDLVSKVCKAAGFKVEECSINLNDKKVTHLPPAPPVTPVTPATPDVKK